MMNIVVQGIWHFIGKYYSMSNVHVIYGLVGYNRVDNIS